MNGSVVFIVAFAAFAQTLFSDFTFDDIPIVRDNQIIRHLSNIEKIFHTNYWGESDRYQTKYAYRPVTILTYAVQYAVHGARPFGYHLVNVLLHALASLLLFRLVALLCASTELAFYIAVLFAVHPIHAEAVAGIVGRGELLACVGVLLCAWAYFRAADAVGRQESKITALSWLALSIFGFTLGTFSKETGILAPAVIVLTELLFPERRMLLRLNWRAIVAFVFYGLVSALFFKLRAQSISGQAWAIDFADMTTYSRVLTALWVALEYVGLLIYPAVLSADYVPANIHVVSSLAQPAAWIAMAALAGTAVFAAWSWRRLPVVCWGLLFFLGTLFPVSNLLFPIGVMKAERILYAPSAGFLIGLTALGLHFFQRKRMEALFLPLVGLVSIIFFMRTTVRNEDWKNNYVLATATLKTAPGSQRMRTVMFNWYREHGQNDMARLYVASSGTDASGNAQNLYNLANLELDSKNYPEAIRLYRQVLDARPGDASALNNLGQALVEAGRLDEALKVFTELMQQHPDSPGPYVNLVDIYVRRKDFQGALPIAEAAVSKFPREDVAWWNVGVVYGQLGRSNEAVAAFVEAQRINPDISRVQNVRREF